MELKQYEIQQWSKGCTAFDNRDYDLALRTFMRIGDNAKMHFNIGLIFGTINDHRRSLAAFNKALSLDPFYAVASFQKGVSHFLMGDLVSACEDFDQAHQKLRGNTIINYHQLGLPFRLYECEVLFNRGICQLHLGKIDAGLTDLYFAQKKKMSREHVVVDQAVRDRGKGYSVFSIPPGILYRPPEYKIHGLLHIDENDFVLSFEDGTYRRRLRNNSFLLPTGPGGREGSAAASYRQEDPVTQDTDGRHPRHEQDEWPHAQTTATTIAARPYRYCKQEHEPASPQSIDSMDDPLPPIIKKPETPAMFTDEYTWKVARHRCTSNSISIHTNNKDSGKTSMVTPTYATNNSMDNRKMDDGYVPSPSYDDEEDPNAMQSMLDEELDRILAALTTNQDIPVGAIPGLHKAPALPAATTGGWRAETPAGREDAVEASVAGAKVKPDLPQQHNNKTLKTAHTSKLKLKVHFHDTRALLMPSNITFADLMTRIHEKFDVPLSVPLRLQYKDDEQQHVLMIDQEDLIMARRIYRLRNKSSMGDEKLELWCST
ncbi:hypothetical protein BCR43DRAFT_485879 [Syncephalastrum racemosum]|uniref:PB1 domain-containing protein n=1 Tax=Syncephalastrum racemosum TaxID=13706 RepID=A0A1X2HPL6_SYNRA|nr:hypothetical protein BCR43DRAFT_485879 [Syncephalastrum racemosum]